MIWNSSFLKCLGSVRVYLLFDSEEKKIKNKLEAKKIQFVTISIIPLYSTEYENAMMIYYKKSTNR